MADTGRMLVEHKSAAGATLTQVRGSFLAASLATLREFGYYERYLELLPAESRDAILFTLAHSWVPIELAMTHYAACDALALTDAQLDALGQHASTRLVDSFLGSLLRSSRKVGASVSPLLLLQQFDRMWDRAFMGGSCIVRETGPKDAVVEARGVPLCTYRYFRVAFVGVLRGAGMLLTKTCHARLLRVSSDSVVLSIAWV